MPDQRPRKEPCKYCLCERCQCRTRFNTGKSYHTERPSRAQKIEEDSPYYENSRRDLEEGRD